MVGDGKKTTQMDMVNKIKYILLFFLFSSFLYSSSKEDRVIKASLYPYTVKGTTYYPHKVALGESKEVLASWYGEYFHGRKTAMGEVYDMYGHTAAHKTYPLGTVLLVTNPENGKSLKVRINDRGPFWNNREVDLSMGAAEFLGTKEQGVAKVKIEVVFVPDVVNSFVAVKGKKEPLKVEYNLGYSAISYSTITQKTEVILIEIGIFRTKDEVNKYLKKLKKYIPLAHIVKKKRDYKVVFELKAEESYVKKELKKLKKKSLISGYGLCWSYD